MSKTTTATLAGLLGYSILGFSFLFSKIALAWLSPLTLLSLRFLLAFLTLNLLLLTGKVRLELKGKPVRSLLLMGLVQPVFYFIFETYGIALTSATFSGIMISLAPMAGLIFGAVFLKERCTLFQAVCTLLSVLGVALTTTGGLGSFSLPGFLCLTGAVVCAALFAILSRGVAPHFSAFERTYVSFGMGSVAFTFIALAELRGDLSSLAVSLQQPAIWGCLVYLAIISSVVAFLLINYSLGYVNAGRILIFNNLTSAISVLAGILILRDSFTVVQLLGILLILIGVCGVSRQKENKD